MSDRDTIEVNWKAWAKELEEYLRNKGDYGYPSLVPHLGKMSEQEPLNCEEVKIRDEDYSREINSSSPMNEYIAKSDEAAKAAFKF